MKFIINYDRAEHGDFLAPQGDYETIITQAKFDCTVSGIDYIRLTLRIREDIAQEGAGELLEYPIWKLREPTVRDPEGYPNCTLQFLARCAGLQNGKKVSGLPGLLDALCWRPIKVSVKHEKYYGLIREKVSYIMPSDKPEVMAGFGEDSQWMLQTNELIKISAGPGGINSRQKDTNV